MKGNINMSRFNAEKAAARLSAIIALEYGAGKAAAKRIGAAAAVRDIGKMVIPDSILYKSGKLTECEYEIMKTHTIFGADMLESIQGELGETARLIATYHHERFDGNGYWDKPLSELPFYLPLVTISDVLCGLISDRPYQPEWPYESALEYIHNQAGYQFDPLLADLFISLIRNDDRARVIIEGRR